MNKSELEAMEDLREQLAEAKAGKIPQYEKQIKALEAKIKKLNQCKQIFTPKLTETAFMKMKELCKEYPDLDFELTIGGDHSHQQVRLTSSQVR